MKKIIFAGLLLNTFFSYSQNITETLKASIETEKVEELLIEFKKLDYSINACFVLREKPCSLFCIAVKLGKEKLFDYLIEQKADINIICEDNSPLKYAVKYGNFKMVKKLLESGANIKTENNKGRTALYYAKKHKQKEILNYLETVAK